MLTSADARTLKRLFPEVVIALAAARVLLGARRELQAAERQHIETGQAKRRYQRAQGAEQVAAAMLGTALQTVEMPESI